MDTEILSAERVKALRASYQTYSDAASHQVCKDMLSALASHEALRKRAESAENGLGNLLAIIHRDGGHYLQEHGAQKAVDDAHTIWAELIQRAEELETERENAKFWRDLRRLVSLEVEKQRQRAEQAEAGAAALRRERDEALEEAAKKCDEQHRQGNASWVCAREIRAMKGKL